MNASPLKNLVSMKDFVFHLRNMTTSELCKTYPKNFKTPVWNGNQSDRVKDMLAIDAIQWKLTGEYAKFISQPLALWMFVPVGDDGEVLEEPYFDGENDMYYGAAKDAYNKAKSRCLFEGFSLSEDGLSVFIKDTVSEFHISLDEIENEGYSIECLFGENLSLTPTAITQMFG